MAVMRPGSVGELAWQEMKPNNLTSTDLNSPIGCIYNENEPSITTKRGVD